MTTLPIITSLHNSRVKEAVRLRDRRHRKKQGRILIDGARELRLALSAGVVLHEMFLCESLCQSDDTRQLLAALPATGCELLRVNESVFEKLAFGQRAEGVLGVAAMPRQTLESLAFRCKNSSTSAPTTKENSRGLTAPGTPPLIAVLEGVEKPGNFGAVLRSADAAGASAVIAADPRTDLFNPNAIRASLGTIFAMPVCAAAGAEVLAWLRQREMKIFAARVDGSVSYTECDYRGPTAFVLGSEAAGLSSLWTGDDIQAVRLPMLGAADSLNVSVTAAVLFYEALRQRSECV